MDPVTLGLGLGLGAVNTGLSMYGASQQKRAGKKVAKLDKQMMINNRKRALEELQVKENQINHQNEFDVSGINEGMNQREVLDSSITPDAQNERQYQLEERLGAIQRSRGDIDYEYDMLMKRKKIGQKLADATEWIGMLQTAIQGGAMGVGMAGGK